MDFTHEIAREALASGEIPVCQRLLSPSQEMEESEVADAAEICGRVLAFGSPWSRETWAAVRAAKRSGVPVETFPADGWRGAFPSRTGAESRAAPEGRTETEQGHRKRTRNAPSR